MRTDKGPPNASPAPLEETGNAMASFVKHTLATGSKALPVPPEQLMSVLPPLSSFTVANAMQLAKLLLQPILFFITLPWFLSLGALKYFVFGGREKNRALAEALPGIVSSRLARMSQEAALPAGAGVTTSTRDAAKGGPRGFSSQFVDNGEVTLHVVSGGDFSSSKPILLFLHGFPECWSTWERQMVYFARLGFPVAAMDLRGYGLSTSPQRVGAYGMRSLVSDVCKVVRKIRAQGDQEVVLVGHDWGGVLAWNVAFMQSTEETAAITKFAILNAPHPGWFGKYALTRDRFQLLRSWYMAWFQFPWISEFWMYSAPHRFARVLSSSDHATLLSCVADPATCFGMLALYRAAVRDGITRASPKPVPVSKPVLQLWGEHDEALAAGLVTQMPRDRWVPHRQSRVTLLDASHWIMHDKSKEVNEAILRFVQEQ